MLNLTIGGGIFTQPGYVLALTCSKQVSLVLWAVGGVYTAISMIIFLEYGTALPYNGGILIYLDEVFPRPRVYATVLFSFYTIVFAGTVTASRNVAQSVLTLAYPGEPIEEGILRYTAIVVQTVACLMLFFARRLCFVLSSGFAAFKVILLITIFIAGFASTSGSELKDFTTSHQGFNSLNAAQGMIYVLYAYPVWDNVNMIAGEIKDCKRTLNTSPKKPSEEEFQPLVPFMNSCHCRTRAPIDQ